MKHTKQAPPTTGSTHYMRTWVTCVVIDGQTKATKSFFFMYPFLVPLRRLAVDLYAYIILHSLALAFIV